MEILSETELIQVGQRVADAYKRGAVVAIHDEQRPANVQRLGVLGGVIGGRAYFDILFNDGTQAKMLPESILRAGLAWRVFAEIAPAEELDQLRQAVAEHEERERLEAEETARLCVVERARCLREYDFMELAEGSNKTPWALCASNIRKELAKTFPGIKFRVRSDSFAGGDSVDVDWVDGPTMSAVEQIVDKYKEGNFNGMIDMYEDRRGPGAVFEGLFGGTKYLHVDRNFSDEALLQALQSIHQEHDAPENPVPAIAEYKAGRLLSVIPSQDWHSYQELVSDYLKDLDLTPRVPAVHETETLSAGLVTGVLVRHNEKMNGVEIAFPARPDAACLEQLKDSGFRWSPRAKVWYAKWSPTMWTAAHRLAGLPVPATEAKAS